jgi:hypothetical protein
LTDIKFFCAHKHKTLTILSLTAENVSSALCSRILGIPVARECRIFHNLETIFITHDALWAANELIYKNPSDIASYFSQVYQYLAENICPNLEGNILMIAYKHILMWLSLFSQQRL